MKRKIIYGLLSLFILGGVYFGLRKGFGYFTSYNAFTARQDISNRHIQIIVIGEPNKPQLRQRLAKQYGFEFNYIGCYATTELLNGSKYYNEVVINHLTDKFGKEFWIRFNNQIDSIDKANPN